MTGEVLYLMYWKFHKEQGTGIDSWAQLDPQERTVWNLLVRWIEETAGE